MEAARQPFRLTRPTEEDALMSRRTRRMIGLLGAPVLTLALGAAPAAAAAPTITEWTDPPSDDVVVDCGGYEIREVSVFSARAVAYDDGTVRVQARIEGWLYRSDEPDRVIGHEVARTVRAIDGTVAQITGNRWHIVIYGSGSAVHDVGRIDWDFTTGEVFAESGSHPVFEGTFDFATLCAL
jgi:hypothetical protein